MTPMVPPDVDLRGMPWMPLDTVRLIDSDLFALSTGDEFKAAVALWCKSWTQQPAASLPSDDRILAHLSGAGTRWKKLKPMALRGWILCDDGRLYHPVIAEKALEAWEQREEYQERQDNEKTRLQQFRAEHKALRRKLREHGIVLPFDTKIDVLRERVATLPETKPETQPETKTFQDGNACNAPAMAKTGTGTGIGIYQEQELSPRRPSQDSSPGTGDDAPVPGEQDLPAWVPLPIWREFYRHRAVIRKPLSIPSQRQVVQRLTELREQNHDIATSLAQTIGAGLAIPVIPKDHDHAERPSGRKLSAVEQVQQAILERRAREQSGDDTPPALSHG